VLSLRLDELVEDDNGGVKYAAITG
jgi:hypothetical protein